MRHFKDFLIKLQTLDIQIKNSYSAANSPEQVVNSYELSHENPFLSAPFKNKLKELKELAITDVLNLPREQIHFQLQRFRDVKEVFSRFWDTYYHSPVQIGSQHNLELILSLNLNDLFICPFLSFMDHAKANDSFIDDLVSTIRHREEILKEFEEAVLKVINHNKEPKNSALIQPVTNKTRAMPTFKEGIAGEFFSLIKEYFADTDRQRLLQLLTSTDLIQEPLVFNGAGNQLADAFKQLFDSNLIVGCNKAELENWILQNFQYRDKALVKKYIEKYLQDIISSNTKTCQSPLFDVRKTGGQFYISPLTRNNRNLKK